MTRAILLTGQCYFFTWGERIAAEEEPGRATPASAQPSGTPDEREPDVGNGTLFFR